MIILMIRKGHIVHNAQLEVRCPFQGQWRYTTFVNMTSVLYFYYLISFGNEEFKM